MNREAEWAFPRSCSSRFMIGKDAQGHWVVCDAKGLVGGVFFDRSAAIHFAAAESGYEPGAVCCAPESAVLTIDPLFRAGPAPRRPEEVRTI